MNTEENMPLVARSAGRDRNSRSRLIVLPCAPRRRFQSRPALQATNLPDEHRDRTTLITTTTNGSIARYETAGEPADLSTSKAMDFASLGEVGVRSLK